MICLPRFTVGLLKALTPRISWTRNLFLPNRGCTHLYIDDSAATSVRTWQGLEAGSLDLPDWVGRRLSDSVDGTLTLRAAIIHYRGTTVTDPGGGGNARRHIMVGGSTSW
jgi:hypothetical protein